MLEKELHENIRRILFERDTDFLEHSAKVSETVERIFRDIKEETEKTESAGNMPDSVSEAARKAYWDGLKTGIKIMLKIFTE